MGTPSCLLSVQSEQRTQAWAGASAGLKPQERSQLELQLFHPSTGLTCGPRPLFSVSNVTFRAPREEVAKPGAGAWRSQVEA